MCCFDVFGLNDGDLTWLVMFFSGSKNHSKLSIFLSRSLLFYMMPYSCPNIIWYYVFFSFFLLFVCMTCFVLYEIVPMIIIIIVHGVECVCANQTCSTHGPFACWFMYTTLSSIEPSLGRFYGMSWLWWGACLLP